MSLGAGGKGSFDSGCVKKQLIRRAKRSLSAMGLKKVKQIRALYIFKILKVMILIATLNLILL